MTGTAAEINLILAVTALGLPLASFLLILLFTRGYSRFSAWFSTACMGISMISALLLLFYLRQMENPLEYSILWFKGSDFSIYFGFLLDPVSLTMFALAGVICFLVQVYSLGYMDDDPGKSRYYAFQSLFAWSMLSLSISSSLIQLYFFWELVGLCSYLLIGFWFEKFSATAAGKKAFVMTRLGDVGFFIGVLLLMLTLGNTLISGINDPSSASRMSQSFITLTAVLIFIGIAGKSAQFPLFTWLPDAMEGPTPVSALLHSATMVAAGVFLFVRLFPFFSLSSHAMTLFLAVGTVTMLMSGTMAMVDRDIKKVWAYSTISQLGYMIMGLSAGSQLSGFFHMTTHATFKALLFLCSGVWIHYFETNDMYEIAKMNGRNLKIPFVCTILAAASLAGIPPMSGFFSKEAILTTLLDKPSPIWITAGILGVFMTAYYAFRPVFIILFPENPDRENRVDKRGFDYRIMTWPLIVLAAFTSLLGFFEGGFARFLSLTVPEEKLWFIFLIVTIGLCGLFLAWFEFGRKGAPQKGFIQRYTLVEGFFLNRWCVDAFYAFLLNKIIYRIFARFLNLNDRKVIDGGIDIFCKSMKKGGRLFSGVQSGKLRMNLLVMFFVLSVAGLLIFL